MRRDNRNVSTIAGAGAAAIVATLLLAPGAHAGWRFSDWRTPMPVDNVAGGCPIETPDGLTLFTAGGFDGTLDIWTNERSRKRAPFEPRMKVGAPVSLDDADDFCPTPMERDYLFFVSDRPADDSCGGADMFVVRIGDNPKPPRRLACAPHGPNTEGRELAPALVVNRKGMFLYYSTNGPNGDQDIYKSRLEWDGSFGPGEPVHELNTSFNDQQPNLSRNGKEIVFSSDRAGAGQDVFTAKRHRLRDSWSEPRNLSVELNFPTVNGSETRASLSFDRKRLYYGSGGTIYVSERKRRGRDDDDDEDDDD